MDRKCCSRRCNNKVHGERHLAERLLLRRANETLSSRSRRRLRPEDTRRDALKLRLKNRLDKWHTIGRRRQYWPLMATTTELGTIESSRLAETIGHSGSQRPAARSPNCCGLLQRVYTSRWRHRKGPPRSSPTLKTAVERPMQT